jgi:hypothetical protein
VYQPALLHPKKGPANSPRERRMCCVARLSARIVGSAALERRASLPSMVQLVDAGGARTLLAVPRLKEAR